MLEFINFVHTSAKILFRISKNRHTVHHFHDEPGQPIAPFTLLTHLFRKSNGILKILTFYRPDAVTVTQPTVSKCWRKQLQQATDILDFLVKSGPSLVWVISVMTLCRRQLLLQI